MPTSPVTSAGAGKRNNLLGSGGGKSQRRGQAQGRPSSAATDSSDISDVRSLKSHARRIQVKGLAVVDGRIHAARIIKKWQRALISDLGGPGALSTAQLTLVELSTRTKLVLEHLDAYLLTKKSLILKRQGKLIPMVMDRMKVSDTLTRQLLALGLERRTRTIPALASYVDQTYSKSSLSQDPVPEGKGPRL